MKRIMILLTALAIFSGSLTVQGCYGSFSLTKKVYQWNGSMENKYINSIVMWVLFVVPVYGGAGFVDLFILNVIEFWQGKNPVAMNEGEFQEQSVTLNGKQYRISAVKNSITVTPEDGSQDAVTLRFEPVSATWYIEKNGESIAVAKKGISPEELVLIKSDGKTLRVPLAE